MNFNNLLRNERQLKAATGMTKEEFRNTENKLDISARMNRADCHLPISEDAAAIPVRIKRTITENLTELHYSTDFDGC